MVISKIKRSSLLRREREIKLQNYVIDIKSRLRFEIRQHLKLTNSVTPGQIKDLMIDMIDRAIKQGYLT